MDFNKQLQRLNKVQRQAVEQTEGPLLVLAGPGTGKTQIISIRVANILQQTDTAPENVLCLTFTESGAMNMRTRLASIVGAKAAAKIHIHTYHAFGSQIINAYQYYSEAPVRLYESAIDNVATYQILTEIQSDLPSSDILKNAKISEMAATIKDLKSARLTADDVKKIAETNLDSSASLNSAILPLLQEIIPRKYDENIVTYGKILAAITEFTSPEPIAKNIELEANFLARSLAKVLEDQANAEKKSIQPLSKWKDAHFEKDRQGNYRSKNFISNKKLFSMANILAKYQAQLEAKNLFDYADMIEQAIEYLAADQGFRFSQQEKYQYILLDEFQDTNPSQFDLVKALTDYDQPNIMAVGDDDQAIMAFQGAEASNLLDFQRKYNAKVLSLTENYRSTQPILDLSRRIADQIEDSFSNAHQINKNLLVATSRQPNIAELDTAITRHQFPVAPSEYYWISTQIAELLKQGVQPSKIAIITPKHKYITDLLPHLALQKIPFAYEKQANILNDPAMANLIVLARFISAVANNRQSSHLLLELLSAPYWGVNATVVVNLLNEAKERHHSALAYLAESQDQSVRVLAEFFADLATRSFDTPLELFIDYLVGAAPLNDFRSPFLSYYSAGSNSATEAAFELYENLSVLREAIVKHVRKDNLRLVDFVQTIEDYTVANEPITNTSPYQSADEAIQILSVHKSKGLEFDHVFMVAVDDSAWGNAGGNNNSLTLPKNLAHVRHTGITEDERLRVLFVAISRAATHLYLTNSLQDFAGKNSAPLEYLEESDGVSPLLPEKSQTIVIHNDEAPSLAIIQNHWSKAYYKVVPDHTAILKARVSQYRLSPTDLTQFIDVKYGGPLKFYLEKLLKAPRQPATLENIYGNLIHATLDHATKHKSLTEDELISYYQQQLDALDLSAGEKSALGEQGMTNLPLIFAKFNANIRANSTRSEVNFKSENITLNGVPITGTIDQLLIDEEQKTIQIIDFKTTVFNPKKHWRNDLTIHKYQLQLGFYKLLLNNSPKYAKYQVKSASLEHLNPDPYGQLVSRPYIFNEKDEKHLKDLIKAVYKHIQKLDFPDIADYGDELKGTLELEEFLKNH